MCGGGKSQHRWTWLWSILIYESDYSGSGAAHFIQGESSHPKSRTAKHVDERGAAFFNMAMAHHSARARGGWGTIKQHWAMKTFARALWFWMKAFMGEYGKTLLSLLPHGESWCTPCKLLSMTKNKETAKAFTVISRKQQKYRPPGCEYHLFTALQHVTSKNWTASWGTFDFLMLTKT